MRLQCSPWNTRDRRNRGRFSIGSEKPPTHSSKRLLNVCAEPLEMPVAPATARPRSLSMSFTDDPAPAKKTRIAAHEPDAKNKTSTSPMSTMTRPCSSTSRRCQSRPSPFPMTMRQGWPGRLRGNRRKAKRLLGLADTLLWPLGLCQAECKRWQRLPS